VKNKKQLELNWKLVQATRKGDLKEVKKLVAEGANPSSLSKAPNDQNGMGQVAIREAIIINKKDVLKYFLTIKGIDVNAKNAHDSSNAVMLFNNIYNIKNDKDFPKILKTLLKLGLDLGATNPHESPITKAIQVNRIDLLEIMLTEGKDIDLNKFQNNNIQMQGVIAPMPPESILTVAVNNLQTEEKAIDLLLEHGAEVNPKGENLIATPLSKAAMLGSAKLVKKFLDAGAEVNPKNLNQSILANSITHFLGVKEAKNMEEIVDLLLKNGAEVNPKAEMMPGGGMAMVESPLAKAAMIGNFELVKKLLDVGAEVNSEGGNSPLTNVINNRPDNPKETQKIIDLLLKSGANVNAFSNNGGMSPFMSAITKGNVKLVQRMIKDHKADINIVPQNIMNISHNNSLYFALNNDINGYINAKRDEKFKMTKLLFSSFKNTSDSILISTLTSSTLNQNLGVNIHMDQPIMGIRTDLGINNGPVGYNVINMPDEEKVKYNNFLHNQHFNNNMIAPHIKNGILEISLKLKELDGKKQKILPKTENKIITLFGKILKQSGIDEVKKLFPKNGIIQKLKAVNVSDDFELDKLKIVEKLISKINNPNIKILQGNDYEPLLKIIQNQNLKKDLLEAIVKGVIKKIDNSSMGLKHLKDSFEQQNLNFNKIIFDELKKLAKTDIEKFFLALKYNKTEAKELFASAIKHYNKINDNKEFKAFEKAILESIAYSTKQNDDLIDLIIKSFPKVNLSKAFDKNNNDILITKAQNDSYDFIKKYHNKTDQEGLPVFNLNHINKFGNKVIDIISLRVFRDAQKDLLGMINILRKSGSLEPKEAIASFSPSINIKLIHNIINEKPLKKIQEYLKKKHPLTKEKIDKAIKDLNKFLLENKKNLTDNSYEVKGSKIENSKKDIVKGILNEKGFKQVLDNINSFTNSKMEQTEANVKFYANVEMARAWEEAKATENIGGFIKMLSATHSCISGQFLNLLKIFEKSDNFIVKPIINFQKLQNSTEIVMKKVLEKLYDKYPDKLVQEIVYSFYQDYMKFAGDYTKGQKFITTSKNAQPFISACFEVLLEQIEQEKNIKNPINTHITSLDITTFVNNIIGYEVSEYEMSFDEDDEENAEFLHLLIHASESAKLFKNPFKTPEKVISELTGYFKIADFFRDEFLNKMHEVNFGSKDFSASMTSLFKEKDKSFKELSDKSKLGLKYFANSAKEIMKNNVTDKKLLSKMDSLEFQTLFVYLMKGCNSKTQSQNSIYKIIDNSGEELKLSKQGKYYEKVKNILNLMNFYPDFSKDLFNDINIKILTKKTEVTNWFNDFKKSKVLSKYSKDGVEISKDIKMSLIDFMKLNLKVEDLNDISDKNLHEFFKILSSNDSKLKPLLEYNSDVIGDINSDNE
jgi:hypothetical protein